MDGINSSKKGTVKDFVTNAAKVLKSVGDDVTQWKFGGSVMLFGFTRRVRLMLGITAYVERRVPAASKMQTWPRSFRRRRQRPRALSRHADPPRSYAS